MAKSAHDKSAHEKKSHEKKPSKFDESKRKFDESQAKAKEKLKELKAVSKWKWFWAYVWFLMSFPFKWIWAECHDWRVLVIFLIVFAIFSASVWIWYVLAGITWGSDFSKWCLGIGSAVWVWWLGPFTPFLPLCIFTTMGIKALFDKISAKRKRRNENAIQEENGKEAE